MLLFAIKTGLQVVLWFVVSIYQVLYWPSLLTVSTSFACRVL